MDGKSELVEDWKKFNENEELKEEDLSLNYDKTFFANLLNYIFSCCAL